MGYVEHELAEPAVGWVFGEAGVPEHGDRVLGDGHGSWAGSERGGGGAFAETGRAGEDQVALGDDFEGGSEVGDAKGDAAVEAFSLKHAVDDAGAFAAGGDEDVVEVGVGFDREPAFAGEGRVLAAGEATEGVAEEGLALELGVDLDAQVEGVRVEEDGVDGEIDVAGFEAVGEALRCGDDGEVDGGGLLGDALEERGQDEGVEQVGGCLLYTSDAADDDYTV